MFGVASPTATRRLFDFMEQIAPRFEAAGFEVEGVFHKRWTDGDYGMILKSHAQPVLYLGIWSELWRERGHALCIGVHRDQWAPVVVAHFQHRFPDWEAFPPRDANPFLVKGVDPVLLGGDAVHDVSQWLLRGYLKAVKPV